MVNQKQNIIRRFFFSKFFVKFKFTLYQKNITFLKMIIIGDKYFYTYHIIRNNDRRVKNRPYLSLASQN